MVAMLRFRYRLKAQSSKLKAQSSKLKAQSSKRKKSAGELRVKPCLLELAVEAVSCHDMRSPKVHLEKQRNPGEYGPYLASI